MRKKLIIVMLMAVMATSMTGCGHDNSIVENSGEKEETTKMFERHKLGDGYAVLVEKETGICYLEYKHYSVGNGSLYSLTVMMNPDGTPKIWEEKD